MLGAREATLTLPDAPLTLTLVVAPTDSATALADTLSSAQAGATHRSHADIAASPNPIKRRIAVTLKVRSVRPAGFPSAGRSTSSLRTESENNLNASMVFRVGWAASLAPVPA